MKLIKLVIFTTFLGFLFSTNLYASNTTESFRKMGVSLGKLSSIVAMMSAVIPACQMSNSRVFYVDYGEKFLLHFPPILGGIKGINTELTEKRHGSEQAAKINELMNSQMQQSYLSFSREFASTSKSDLDIVCLNFFKLIRAGEYDFYKPAEQYFSALSDVDKELYASGKQIFMQLILLNNDLNSVLNKK